MRGGKRAGAGRPKGSLSGVPRKMFAVRLPVWLCEWVLKQKESKQKLIEDALVGTYGLKKGE